MVLKWILHSSQNIMTTPTFWNEFAWMPWKVRDHLTAVKESEEPFVCLLLCVMGKAVDLSDFDSSQIVMRRRLGIIF